MVIKNCRRLDLPDEEWEGLQSLKYLAMEEIMELKSLPEGIKHLTSLKDLFITNCLELTTLTEVIGDLTSLEWLSIRDCHKLAMLPQSYLNKEQDGDLALQMKINACYSWIFQCTTLGSRFLRIQPNQLRSPALSQPIGNRRTAQHWKRTMTDHSETQQPPRTNANLTAANTALLAENQWMAELLAAMQNNGDRKVDSKRTNAEQHEEHQSESNAKTEETVTKSRRRRANPFSKDIMSYKMPQNFTLLMTLTPYKGIGDPKVHVTKFESMMFLNSDCDPILCRSFPTFLNGAALQWFSNFPAGSITSFDEFVKMFINHFAASKIYVRDSDYLITINQGLHESLKDYMTRFTTAAMEIPDLNPEVQLHAIKSGLQPGKFQEAIAVAKPKTLEEFQDKATGQIEIEELRETRRNEKPPSRKDDDKSGRFNTRREDIIKDILHNRLIKPPVKAGTYHDQKYVDKGKHCAFHQKFGHTTDEYVAAKDLLERLARQGLLDKYIGSRNQKEAADTSKPRYNSERRDKGTWCDPVETPTSKGIINNISGGFAGGGITSTERKQNYRAMMTMEGTQ
ncbi:uncharacterized protein LOC107485479 [Arachis duranensis]|uniref:Uncharacterized protein LOC107485479 n=1 Tax=Arachis duranensis TaxID=130453 RepID=A0A6P4D2V8_ARADU|nr:uncharacterized protein LOC107485479 [Arachis duranensis]